MNAYEIFKTQMDKEVEQGTKSDRTRDEYLAIAKKLLSGTFDGASIRSKARFSQVSAVIRLLKLTGAVEAGESFGLNLALLRDEFKKSESENHKIARITEKVLTPEQFDALLAAMPNTKDGQELRRAAILSRRCGARLSEVLALTPGDFTEAPNALVVSIRSGKGRKPRTVYLPVSAKEMLSGFTGFSISRQYVNLATSRAMKKAGIHSSFHGLRHTFATEATQNGVDLRAMADILGHADPKTTMLYTHVKKEVPEMLLNLWKSQNL